MTTRKISTLPPSVFSELAKDWVQKNLVQEEELYDVLVNHSENSEQFLAIRDSNLLRESILLQDLATSMSCHYWDEKHLLDSVAKESELVTKFPPHSLEHLCIVPIHLKDGYLQVAISSWPGPEIFNLLKSHTQAQNILFGFSERNSIKAALSFALAQNLDETQLMPSVEIQVPPEAETQVMPSVEVRVTPEAEPGPASQINNALFDDSWDQWETVEPQSTPKAPALEEQPMSTHSPEAASNGGNVDNLLANFLDTGGKLTPVPTPSQANSQQGIPAQSSSLEDLDGAAPSPRILSSNASLDAAFDSHGDSATGLAALELARSSQEWQASVSMSRSDMYSSASSSALPAGGGIGNPNSETSRSQHTKANKRKKKRKKNDQARTNVMAFIHLVFRILVAIFVGYLIYQGYQNGI